MGRTATVASGNVWYEARIEASKGNERLSSRAGAAELAGMSEDAIKNTELGLEKQMPVDKAVILADLYNAPNLLNHYCLTECPIGKNHPLSDKVQTIDRITVKLLRSLKLDELESIKDKMLEVASDGDITDEEVPDLEGVLDYLEKLVVVTSELRTLVKLAVRKRR